MPLARENCRTEAERVRSDLVPSMFGFVLVPGTDGRTIMKLQNRDLVATGLVAAAGAIYLLWLLDAVPTGMSGVRVTGAVILALGFAASATAVMPTFDQLLHGNRIYLAVTSLLGLVALVAGVVMLVGPSQTAMAVVMVAMFGMWIIATIHHSLLAKTTSPLEADQVGDTERPKVTI